MRTTTKSETLQCVWKTLGDCRGLFVPEWSQWGAENFFTARQGGVSEEAYTSLNMGLHVADDEKKVCRNRVKIAQALHILPQQMVFCEQVHGTEIYKVTAKDAGRGVFSYQEAIEHTDALITNEKQLYLTLLFADCIPLYFFDPTEQAIGVAHGGWKGAWGEIGVKTVQAMQREFGCNPSQIQCWIGPGIGPCCFEIGDDLAEQVRMRSGWDAYLVLKEDGKWSWDLKRTHRHMLLEQGLLEDHILLSDDCTSCREQEFFSYRRDQGITGRMAAILGLRA